MENIKTQIDESLETQDTVSSNELKSNLIIPWIEGTKILDVGIGSAFLSNGLARAGMSVTSLDKDGNALAKLKPLGAVPLFGDILDFKEKSKFETVIMSSVLHEVYSYNGRNLTPVEKALYNAHNSLVKGGRLIIRDFVKPRSSSIPVTLAQLKSDSCKLNNFFKFKKEFVGKTTFQQFSTLGDLFLYETDYRSAYEYIFHKDYKQNWEAEVKEEYAFWTADDAKSLLSALGFKLVFYSEFDNPWITRNRLINKIKILSTEGYQLPYPKYQNIIVAEKA